MHFWCFDLSFAPFTSLSQVKVRGHRIELEEVEVQILQALGMKECVVTCQDVGAEVWLVCYYTGEVLPSSSHGCILQF